MKFKTLLLAILMAFAVSGCAYDGVADYEYSVHGSVYDHRYDIRHNGIYSGHPYRYYYYRGNRIGVYYRPHRRCRFLSEEDYEAGRRYPSQTSRMMGSNSRYLYCVPRYRYRHRYRYGY